MEDIIKIYALLGKKFYLHHIKYLVSAKDIIINSAKDFSKQIIALTNKLEINDNYILALRGGMLENSKTFRKTLLDELSSNNQNFIVDDSNNEPVFGALQVMQGEKK